MELEDPITVNQACMLINAYNILFRRLAKIHGIRIVRKGQFSYVARQDAERLRPFVREWRDRPRMSRPISA